MTLYSTVRLAEVFAINLARQNQFFLEANTLNSFSMLPATDDDADVRENFSLSNSNRFSFRAPDVIQLNPEMSLRQSSKEILSQLSLSSIEHAQPSPIPISASDINLVRSTS